ncbi:hypothetical protein M0802_007148 [Mischocyttarus mexicanus]|nr:hypothetical protein M0802_007148 [Mischocyttarus mexicanus]
MGKGISRKAFRRLTEMPQITRRTAPVPSWIPREPVQKPRRTYTREGETDQGLDRIVSDTPDNNNNNNNNYYYYYYQQQQQQPRTNVRCTQRY